MHVVCPKCGREGRLYLRIKRGYSYIAIRHPDDSECSLGKANMGILSKLHEQLIEAFERRLEEELLRLAEQIEKLEKIRSSTP